jgi:segregation and condensation protein B
MQQLIRQLEALLFVAARPLTLSELASLTETPGEDVAAALELLQSELGERGITLVRSESSAELASAPDLAPLVERFLQDETRTPLSKPALETLAIILHRQPIAKHEIEAIRGIASDQIVRNLLGRGLIEEAGRSQEPGRPVQYATNTALLRFLGVTDVSELPLPDRGNAA